MYIILNGHGAQVCAVHPWTFETLDSAVTYLELHDISPGSVNIYKIEWVWGDGDESD